MGHGLWTWTLGEQSDCGRLLASAVSLRVHNINSSRNLFCEPFDSLYDVRKFDITVRAVSSICEPGFWEAGEGGYGSVSRDFSSNLSLHRPSPHLGV